MTPQARRHENIASCEPHCRYKEVIGGLFTQISISTLNVHNEWNIQERIERYGVDLT